MAEYCKQCSVENFGEDFEDFRGIGDRELADENSGWLVLCEGCGPTIVKNDGTCIARDCLKGHGKGT